MPLESATQESRNKFLENKMNFLRITFLNDNRFYRLSSLYEERVLGELK